LSSSSKNGAPLALETLAVSALIGFAIYGALIWAPTERTMGFLQRIFYFHVSCETVGMIAFFIAFIGNIAYLTTRRPQWDWLAVASVEVGLVFTFVGTVSGSIWAKPAWGVWWVWDERLTSAFVMLVLYASYLLLRRLVDNPERRAVISAVFGAFAFLDVPLVYFSIWWWRTQHPGPMIVTGKLDPNMLKVFLFALMAFTSLMALMIQQRYKLDRLRHTVEELQNETEYRSLEAGK
jgi:heme exporter protein C